MQPICVYESVYAFAFAGQKEATCANLKVDKILQVYSSLVD